MRNSKIEDLEITKQRLQFYRRTAGIDQSRLNEQIFVKKLEQLHGPA